MENVTKLSSDELSHSVLNTLYKDWNKALQLLLQAPIHDIRGKAKSIFVKMSAEETILIRK